MTVLHRFVCVASAIAIVAACSAASSQGNTVSPIDAAGGSSGATSTTAGASGAAGAAGGGSKMPSTPWAMAPGQDNGPGTSIIGTPIPTIDASTMKQCSGARSQGKEVTVDIFIMFDQSKSMSCALPTPSDVGAGAAGAAGATGVAGSAGAGGAVAGSSGGSAGAGGAAPSGEDRWTAVKSALQEFLTAPAAAGINVGIQYFGLGGTQSIFGVQSSCNAADYQGADVEIAALPGNATAIISSLDSHSPLTNTPTAPALTGAINHAIDWKNKHPDDAVIVVLVTDGQPNGCGTVTDVANVARQGFMSTIPTYVIGVTSPGTTCTYDQNPPNEQDLDAVANAGGTGSALIVDLSKDVAQQFLDTMDKIRAKSNPPCQYTLPPAPAGQHLDPMKINVDYTPPGAAMPTTLFSVPSQAACDPTKGGWFYDDPVTPKSVTLCPASCSTVTADVTGQVDIEVGCKTLTTQ